MVSRPGIRACKRSLKLATMPTINASRSTGSAFHIRHINATDDGSFIDLTHKYSADGVTRTVMADGRTIRVEDITKAPERLRLLMTQGNRILVRYG